jgi:hypothetical protein
VLCELVPGGVPKAIIAAHAAQLLDSITRAGARWEPAAALSPAKVDTANEDRGPLLLTTGGKDHAVPEATTKSTLEQ